MKLARRRASAPEEGIATESTPPEPPKGRPPVVFAGILDGRHLWLAVDAQPGALTLRDRASGEVLDLPSEVTEDQPDHRSVRLDLDRLTGETYDVVLVPAPGRTPRPLWTPPLPAAAYRGWALRRGPDGELHVDRLPPERGVVLDAVRTDGDRVVLTLSEPVDDLLLLGPDGAPAGRIGTTFGLADLPTGAGRLLQPVVGSAEEHRPVVRRANDFTRPDAAVLLPHLVDDEDRPRARLRWRADVGLVIRLLAISDAGDDGEDAS